MPCSLRDRRCRASNHMSPRKARHGASALPLETETDDRDPSNSPTPCLIALPDILTAQAATTGCRIYSVVKYTAAPHMRMHDAAGAFCGQLAPAAPRQGLEPGSVCGCVRDRQDLRQLARE